MTLKLTPVKNPSKGMKVRFMIHGGYDHGVILGIDSDIITVGYLDKDIHYRIIARRTAIRKLNQLTSI